MSNSPPVCHTALSPNHSGRRNQPIAKITPHYMGGNCSIELCADICRRNGIEDCFYTGNADGVLTMHCWFQSADCPGPWLEDPEGTLCPRPYARTHARAGAVD